MNKRDEFVQTMIKKKISKLLSLYRIKSETEKELFISEVAKNSDIDLFIADPKKTDTKMKFISQLSIIERDSIKYTKNTDSYIILDTNIIISQRLNLHVYWEYRLDNNNKSIFNHNCNQERCLIFNYKNASTEHKQSIRELSERLRKSKTTTQHPVNPIYATLSYLNQEAIKKLFKYVSKNLTKKQSEILYEIAHSQYAIYHDTAELDIDYNGLDRYIDSYNNNHISEFNIKEHAEFIKAFNHLTDFCCKFVHRNSFGFYNLEYSGKNYFLENGIYTTSEDEFEFETPIEIDNEIVIMNRKAGFRHIRYIYDGKELTTFDKHKVITNKNGDEVCINGEIGVLSREFIGLIKLLDY